MLKKITRAAAPALAVIFSFSCSSEQPPRPEQLMLDDYDFMVRTLNEVFPGKTLVKEVYGVDLQQVLSESREKIHTGMSELDFAVFINDTLRACKGKNMRINPQLSGLDRESVTWQLVHDRIPPEAILKTREICERLSQRQLPEPQTIDLVYFDGAYYSRHDFTVNGAGYKQGMKLVSVDGREPLEIVTGCRDRLNSFDYRHKIFYGDAFGEGAAHNFYRLMPAPPDGVRRFVFQTAEGSSVEIAAANSAIVENKAPQAGFSSIGKAVEYLENEKILYVRIPAMNEDDIPFYDKKIRNILAEHEIAAAVLDVRGNISGSDLVWHRILEFFTDKSDTSFSLVTKRTPEAMHFMDRATALTGFRIIKKGLPIFTPLLGLKEMQLYILNIHSTPEGHKVRPVYIITHDVYAATGNLLSMASRMPNLTTVGLRNPVQLGMGTTPFFFSLPHSQLVISLAFQLDLTGCTSPEDIMHTRVDMEVPFTAEQFIAYLNRDNIGNLPDYLVNHDPFFRKILDRARHNVNGLTVSGAPE